MMVVVDKDTGKVRLKTEEGFRGLQETLSRRMSSTFLSPKF